MNTSYKYVIITPVRNEQEYFEKTIKSVISQTITPIEWIIVDDGSTDNTNKIIGRYTKRFSWIRSIFRQNRGFRKNGSGVIEAFYDGYNSLQSRNWDFIVKLDGDLSFDSYYFENCFRRMSVNSGYGLCGGTIYNSMNGNLILEKQPKFHVRGATKIYKRECWKAIGGLMRAPGWDTIDEVKANMLGWKTGSFPDLKLIHHRYTGKADGIWRNSLKNGIGSYIAGYYPIFMIIKCFKRLFQKPYVLSSFGLAYGFLCGYLKRIPQVEDRTFIKYLRRQQINKILFRETIWK